nr:MAG TPA: hypothetical protein [Herelleviridae sp.]
MIDIITYSAGYFFMQFVKLFSLLKRCLTMVVIFIV